MKLEVNLVKTPINGVGGNYVKFLARSRYDVATEAEALSAIEKFIGENNSTFAAALTDQRMVAQLQSLKGLTISNLQCLRYLLAIKGIDIWYFYVKDSEVNPTDIGANVMEFNVIDRDQSVGFVPFCVKFVQLASDYSISKLYTEINDSFGLFEGSIFSGVVNPLKSIITSIKSPEDAGIGVPKTLTSAANSLLEFINKELKVITE